METSAEEEDSALLEWVNSVEASLRPVKSLKELSDGRLLIGIMHDVAPVHFPEPDHVHLRRLLEGLAQYFHGRVGRGGPTTQLLLDRAKVTGACQDASQLTRLVLLAAIQGDVTHEGGGRYMTAIERLSSASQEAIKTMIALFLPQDQSPASSADGQGDTLQDSGGFLDVGLDLEVRYRKLKQQHVDLVEERDHIDQERVFLKRELEEEALRRQAAEESERLLKQELRVADESRNRVKEDNRAMLEVQFDRKIETLERTYAEQLEFAEQELQKLQDQRDIALDQAKAADRSSTATRNKLEFELEKLRRENEQLQEQKPASSSATPGLHVEHFSTRLETITRERDMAQHELAKAQHDVDQLRQEIEVEKEKHREMRKDLAKAQRAASPLRAFSPGRPPLDLGRTSASPMGVGTASTLAEETVGQRLHSFASDGSVEASSSAAGSPMSSTPAKRASFRLRPPPLPNDGQDAPPLVTRSPSSSSADQMRTLASSQKDDLLERLLSEKERATRAETTLQLKTIEAATLTDQKARDAARIAALEEQVRSEVAQCRDLQGRARDGSERKDDDTSSSLRELHEQVKERDRELQVHRWRGRVESDRLLAQETLMVSCFHDLALKYHKLRVRHDLLQKQCRDEPTQ